MVMTNDLVLWVEVCNWLSANAYCLTWENCVYGLSFDLWDGFNYISFLSVLVPTDHLLFIKCDPNPHSGNYKMFIYS